MKHRNGLIFAAFSTGIELTAEGNLPDNVQWMPPGTHTIQASQGGKPVTKTVRVNAQTAVVANTFLQAALKKSAAGQGDKPFFDFNHDDREASAWPTEFYWGGDDPLTGGVRAKVEWSASGETAITGKDFRRFSPTFTIAADGTVTGSEINMGGFVNRAAFQRIQAMWAKDEPHEEPKGTEMKELMKTLVDLGLITASAQDDEAQAITQVRAKHAEFVQQGKDLVTAKADLKTKEDAAKEAVKAKATAAIEKAVKDGLIAAKDEGKKSFYQAALESDYDKAIAIVEGLPVTAKVIDGTVVEDDDEGKGDNVQAKQEAAVAAIRAKNPNATPDEVFAMAESENPELFKI